MIVSVLVPTYNRPAFLAECLASLAKQTLRRDAYEVLVLNDGGDPVLEVARNAGLRQWQYRDLPHKGQSGACNAGLALAQGEYLTVAHDDDLVLPDKLLTLSASMRDRDVVYGLPQYTDIRGIPTYIPPLLRPFQEKYPVLTWQDIEAGSGLWVHGTATMYRTSVLKDIGGWDEELPTAEEYDLHLRLLYAGHAFHAVPREVVTYRAGGKSRTPAVRAQRADAFTRIYAKFGTDRVAYNAKLTEVQ
jgi:alpha-1,6-rhamnosyltransferase